MSLTFKKHPRATGRAAVGYPHQDVDIKWNKKVIGYIHAPTWQDKDNKWAIRLSTKKQDILEDGNANCTWKWVFLKTEFNSEEDARDYLKRNIGEIMKKYNMYCIEDEIEVS